jgi:hypothetical protein
MGDDVLSALSPFWWSFTSHFLTLTHQQLYLVSCGDATLLDVQFSNVTSAMHVECYFSCITLASLTYAIETKAVMHVIHTNKACLLYVIVNLCELVFLAFPLCPYCAGIIFHLTVERLCGSFDSSTAAQQWPAATSSPWLSQILQIKGRLNILAWPQKFQAKPQIFLSISLCKSIGAEDTNGFPDGRQVTHWYLYPNWFVFVQRNWPKYPRLSPKYLRSARNIWFLMPTSSSDVL